MCISLYTKYIVLADPPVHSKAVCNKSTIALPKQSLKVFLKKYSLSLRQHRCCKRWSACPSLETAWKCTHVPKLCLSCAQAVPKLCPSCAQACIHLQEWPSSTSSFSVQGVSKLEHTLCTNWALAWAHVYISKQFSSLGTPTSTAVHMLLIFLL